jgi:drug/metabolite transporter (DMT)-like permease
MAAPGRATIVAVFALLCLIWGSTWSVIRVGLRGIPPFSGVALRFAIAGTVLLLLALALRLPLGRRPHERALWWVNGLFAFTVSYGVTYWSEQWVPSGLTAVLFATYPLFVAIISHFLLPAESLSRLELWGIVAGFAGVGVIFSEDFSALGGRQVAVASVVMLLSPAAAAMSSVAVKRWGAGVHPFSLTAVPMLICAGATGVLAATVERDLPFVWNASSISALVYLALVGSAVTFTLYYWLLSHLPAKRLALIAYIIPVEAVLIGVFFLDEPITARVVLGSVLVVVGVALAVHRHAATRAADAIEESL